MKKRKNKKKGNFKGYLFFSPFFQKHSKLYKRFHFKKKGCQKTISQSKIHFFPKMLKVPILDNDFKISRNKIK